MLRFMSPPNVRIDFVVPYVLENCFGKANDLKEVCPELELMVFTDRDVTEDPDRVAKALKTADAFFASLVFDYDNVRSHMPPLISLAFLTNLDRVPRCRNAECSTCQTVMPSVARDGSEAQSRHFTSRCMFVSYG